AAVRMRGMQACRAVSRLASEAALVEVGAMGSALPWALVALCFALGVASRSISDTFLVFVPSLQHAFDASRGSVTLIYSFALLVGGTAAPITGWILDRFGLRTLTVAGVIAAAACTAVASQASHLWHLYLSLGLMMGF